MEPVGDRPISAVRLREVPYSSPMILLSWFRYLDLGFHWLDVAQYCLRGVQPCPGLFNRKP